MASQPKFWPSRLFGRSAKAGVDAGFTPTTEMAARIVGKPIGGSRALPQDVIPESAPDFADLELEFAQGLDAPASEASTSRQSQRFVPQKPLTFVTDRRGKQIRARIINLSASGVAIEADFRAMTPDTITMIGAKAVRMGRPIRGGHVFIFDKPLDPARCIPQIVL